MYNEQGSHAHYSGMNAEDAVARIANRKKIQVMKYTQYADVFSWVPSYQDRLILTKQYPFIGIYSRRKIRADFVLVKNNLPLAGWEVKHQDIPGSVDEKLPYAFLNMIHGPWPECGIITSGKYWNGRGADAIHGVTQLGEQLIPTRTKFSMLTPESFEVALDRLIKEHA